MNRPTQLNEISHNYIERRQYVDQDMQAIDKLAVRKDVLKCVKSSEYSSEWYDMLDNAAGRRVLGQEVSRCVQQALENYKLKLDKKGAKIAGTDNIYVVQTYKSDDYRTFNLIDFDAIQPAVSNYADHIPDLQTHPSEFIYIDEFIKGQPVVGVLSLVAEWESDKTFAVEESSIHHKYIGRGLQLKLFQYIITKEKLTIVSGDSQSPGARAMWQRLSKLPGVFVYGWDEEKNKTFHVFDVDDERGFDSVRGPSHIEWDHSLSHHIKDMKEELKHAKRDLRKAVKQLAAAPAKSRRAIRTNIVKLQREMTRIETVLVTYGGKPAINYRLVATRSRKAEDGK